MLIGAAAAAPAGFLEFCDRNREDCGEPEGSIDRARSQAHQFFWASVFTETAHQPAAFSVPKGSRRPTPARPITASAGIASPTPYASTLEPTGHPGLTLSAQDWDRIDRTNRTLNRTIRRQSDGRQYGVGDYWAVPVGRAPRGDCEDYVLAKRRALIEMGYPQTALSIALVVTPWGEDHAILLLATTDGEIVLDNLEQRLMRWDLTDYKWVKRQAPGRTFAWVDIG